MGRSLSNRSQTFKVNLEDSEGGKNCRNNQTERRLNTTNQYLIKLQRKSKRISQKTKSRKIQLHFRRQMKQKDTNQRPWSAKQPRSRAQLRCTNGIKNIIEVIRHTRQRGLETLRRRVLCPTMDKKERKDASTNVQISNTLIFST